ncbi:SHOCT domain-containing protein [Natrinema longum]|uniref:SHOCT domain-containing protein n=1 Tax=Natrinema longum TaxID=370324 RepID=A0A8A2UBN7_9EURY|nr:SHOCT domain-containing protein [Natrinema longum]MBZ6496521.1 SHOCT domain-containing protein [Natrinema longum]QSW85575.1 SHOCT domain-containing protein [Natrinema longum]
MYELVHRYAPASPAGRTAVAIIASVVGVPTLVLGLVGLTGDVALAALFLLVSAVTLIVAGQLTRGVVRQAEAAPDGAPTETSTTDSTENPVETLRRRYAAGDIDDEEFQYRLDRLLETEGTDRRTDEREPVLE